MKKVIAIALALVLLITVGAGTVMAAGESQPSSKVTANVGDISILNKTEMGWKTILSNDIKTANQKDLFIDVSLQCGLYSQTRVSSQKLTPDTSMADAKITVRVLVDEDEADPGEVVFSRRMQQMTAKFAGMITDTDNDGILEPTDGVTDEELELILDTMDAHSFNFVLADLPSGVHNIKVQAMIETNTDYIAGSASATATIGKGSVTVESVRMIKGEDYNIIPELN